VIELFGGGALGSMLGGLFRLVPEFLKWLDKKDERAHERAMFAQQCDLERTRGQIKLGEIDAQRQAGNDAGALEALNAAINQTLKHPDVVARFKSLGADIVGGPPSVLDTYFRSEVNKWTRLAEQVKFEAAD
jgi:hypothetical protein